MKNIIILISTFFISTLFIPKSNFFTRDNQQIEEQIYLKTDRSLYKPGEDIWFNTWIVDRESQKLSTLSDFVHAELINPKGKVMKHIKILAKQGRASADFVLPEDAPGGIYKLRAYTLWMKNFGENNYFEKQLTVQKAILPNLLMSLEFIDKGYGPGQKVYAELELKTLENVPLSAKEFKYTVNVAGKKIMKKELSTNDLGKALIEFKLPEELNSPDGVLNISIEHQERMESISRTIPITLKDVDLQFFPEGGQMVFGVNGKVAFKAVDSNGKPSDIEGYVCDSEGNEIQKFKSFHDGMGAFRLLPETGKTYYAILEKPNSCNSKFELPLAKKNSYHLEVLQEDKEIELHIEAPEKCKVRINGQIKGHSYYNEIHKFNGGANIISIPTQDMPAGILKVSLHSKNDEGLCERLVFVNKHKLMNIEITTDKEKYLPREKVVMDIKTTDNEGNPISANLALSVVNNNLITFANDKQDHILSHLLLSSELKGKIHEPQFYFKKDKPKADKALDYLLMTQGWRQFVKNDTLKISYTPEKAEIKGRLVDANKIPMKNHKLWILGTKDTIFTNDEGYFCFKNRLIYSNVILKTEHDKFNPSTIRLYNYANYYVEPDYIKGKIVDENKNPINNVEIRYIGTNVSTKTNSYGSFSLQKLKNYNILEITSEYYQRKTVRIKNNLKPGTISLKIKEGISIQDIEKIENEYFVVDEENITRFKRKKKSKGAKNCIPPPPVKQVVEILNIVDDADDIVEEFIPEDTEATEEMEIEIVEESEYEDIEVVDDMDIEIIEVVEVTEEEEDEEIFMIVEKMPQFPGGDIALRKHIAANVNYPALARECGIQGKVYVRFEVNKSGEVENVSIARGVDHVIDQEAIRVVQNLPKWSPGEQLGKKVNTWYVVPINFQLDYHYDYCSQPFIKFQVYKAPSANDNLKIFTERKFYSPKYGKIEKVEERTDFRSTIYWNPQIETDKDGNAQVTFYNSDEITSFKAIAEGISNNGIIGRGEKAYFTQLPFSLNAKIPEFLTFGDVLQIPVTLTNNTENDIQGKFNVSKTRALLLKQSYNYLQQINAGESKTIWLNYLVKNKRGIENIEFSFNAEGLSDSFKKQIEILPKGFKASIAMSSSQLNENFEFRVGDVIPGSLKAEFKAFPSILNDLLGGIESILREPYGCFEQTSSSTYPNLLVLDYMKSTGNYTASAKKRALNLTKKGYNRLVGFETSEKGFEWFGNTPAHESLTAYGLMEFTDMAKVYDDVDNEMLDRTRKYLLNKRDGSGGFVASKGKYGFSQASQKLKNAYIVYAFTESGYFDIIPEYHQAYKDAIKSKDAYKMALMANAAHNLQKQEDAKVLLDLINKQIKKAGFGKLKAKESVVRSGGKSLQVETSSLYLMALLKFEVKDFIKIDKVAKYIASSRYGSGGFGSTQATIMALRALTEYAKLQTDEIDGTIGLNLNEKLKKQVNFSRNSPSISYSNLEQYINNDTNFFRVNFSNTKQAIPYTFSIEYNTKTPQSSDECIINLNTEISNNELNMGDVARMNVKIKNKTDEYTPMVLVKIGIPSGLSLQAYQLKELLEKKKVDFYEIFDNYLVFYFTGLKPNQEVIVPLDLKTELPGNFEAPASSAYLYYTNEFKHWVAGEKVEIRK